MDERMIEKNNEQYNGTFIGTLGALGLGNPEGIPTRLKGASPERLQEVIADVLDHLTEPTDLTALACIDGRHTEKNADGSEAASRLRRVGGSASNFAVAFNSDAPIINTLDEKVTLGHQVHTVDAFIADKTGYDRSAHLGGCGGANGEIVDQRAIHENPTIMEATKTFMNIPAVKDYLATTFDDVLAAQVRDNAGRTADYLEASRWDGQAYVDGVTAENPKAVEDLMVDPDDHVYHGHREDALVIVIGEQTLDMDDAFVWNLKASKEIATALAGGRGRDGYTQAIIAEVAKHMAVADRLPGNDTPVLLISNS